MISAGKNLLGVVMFVVIIVGHAFAQAKAKATTKKASPQKSTVKNITASASASEPGKQLNTKEKLVEINTSYGAMIVKLYDSTPLHRDNFIKLVQQGFYDSLLFHRVIDDFMIQGGDPLSRNAADGVQLGNGSAPKRYLLNLSPIFFIKKELWQQPVMIIRKKPAATASFI